MKVTVNKGIFVIILIFSLTLAGAENFKPVRQKTYDDQIYGYFSRALIGKNNDIIASFYKTPLRLFTSEKSIQFAPYGQGPNELTGLWTLCRYKDDIAMVEMPNKIKIFTGKDGTYVWKETKWFKRGPYAHTPRSVVFLDNKWFFAGINFHDMKETDKKISFVKVYGSDGKAIKDMLVRVVKNAKSATPFMHMDHFIEIYKDRLFYLIENELKVTVIDPKGLSVLKELSLETPGYYKPMPQDFYIWKKYDKPGENIEKDMEQWKFSYSRIMKVEIEGNYLVLQFRIFGEKQKKFALLFYNAENFKLEKTVFTDDCFLGARNGEYYFYANGDPGFDEEDADKCTINVYRWQEEK